MQKTEPGKALRTQSFISPPVLSWSDKQPWKLIAEDFSVFTFGGN